MNHTLTSNKHLKERIDTLSEELETIRSGLQTMIKQINQNSHNLEVVAKALEGKETNVVHN